MPSAGPIARGVSRFGPPIALMAVIYTLSAQPDLSSGLGTLDTIGRKLIHMAEYGLLWFLWLRALGYRRPLAAAAIAVGYAITDELHQTTVDGRHGSPIDVLIDTAGVAVAWLLWRRHSARGRAQVQAG
jgi:VanZ family protein